MQPDLAQKLVAAHGSPLMAYDLAAVRTRVKTLLDSFPQDSRLFYSLKANPLPALVRAAREAGSGAEVTSLGEMEAAVAAGFEPKDLLMGGPGKTADEIRRALAAGLRWFSCESFTDAERLSQAAVATGCEAELLLRVNPTEAPDARLAMSGVDSQFGFEEQHLLEAGAAAQLDLPAIRLRGIHVYFGTQMNTVEAIAANTERALATADRVCSALGFKPGVVDVGGGFGWPYALEGEGPDLEGLAAALETVWNASPLREHAQLWFESGRYVCAGSGTLLTTVQDVKPSKTRRYLVLDTGIHHLGGMSGLGRLPRSTITLDNLSAEAETRPEGEEVPLDVVGPLCSPLDSLARNLKLPEPQIGDLLAVPNVGAYGLTASLIGFLSHEAPVEVAHEHGEVREAWQLRTGHQSLSPNTP